MRSFQCSTCMEISCGDCELMEGERLPQPHGWTKWNPLMIIDCSVKNKITARSSLLSTCSSASWEGSHATIPTKIKSQIPAASLTGQSHPVRVISPFSVFTMAVKPDGHAHNYSYKPEQMDWFVKLHFSTTHKLNSGSKNCSSVMYRRWFRSLKKNIWVYEMWWFLRYDPFILRIRPEFWV